MQNQALSPCGPAAMTAVGRDRPALAAADWLALAATPIFAPMALLTVVPDGQPATFCLTSDASPLGSMTLMYLLMGAFHLAPWLRLIAGRRRALQRPDAA